MSREFNRSQLEMFLGVVRKYMQVRGGIVQKDLAEMTNTGVSTMSRFLNQQTKDINPQLIAKIVAKLNIPLHEIIDFVDENYTDHFIRLVKFHKGEEGTAGGEELPRELDGGEEESLNAQEDELVDVLSPAGGTAKRNVGAKISVGGKKRNISFEAGGGDDVKDKMSSLTARQKGFLHDFLNLDTDGRDLVVDIGKNIISYLRQKGIDF